MEPPATPPAIPGPPPEKKPWPMKWTILAIVLFIAVYTAVMIGYRKEQAPHEPYSEAHYRAGYALRDVGWIPFPNAYALAPDAPELQRAPYDLEPLPTGQFDPAAPEAPDWSPLVPEVQQGERPRAVEGPASITGGQPYLGRIHWETPSGFQAPQLVFFRRGREILVFSRVPPRQSDSVDQTAFLIPPEFLETGEYQVWLATTDEMSVWTFEVK